MTQLLQSRVRVVDYQSDNPGWVIAEKWMMETRSVVGLTSGNFFGLARVRKAWDRVLDLFTVLVGFAYLLAPGED